MKPYTIYLYIIALFFVIQLSSCSTERVDAGLNYKTYADLSPYLLEKSQKKQTFEIEDYTADPIIGEQGTKIWLSLGSLVLPNGNFSDYPFKIDLIELYKAKDMIYHKKPTVSDKKIMETRGEIFIRAYKVSEQGKEIELELNSGATFKLEIPTDSISDNIKVYYGIQELRKYNWSDDISVVNANDADLYFTPKTESLEARVGKLGWINAGYAQNGHYSINFESDKDDLSKVEIFAYIPKYRSVLRAHDLQMTGIPSQTDCKIIAMAIDDQGQLYADTNTIVLKSSKNYTVNLSEISDQALTAILDELKPLKAEVTTEERDEE